MLTQKQIKSIFPILFIFSLVFTFCNHQEDKEKSFKGDSENQKEKSNHLKQKDIETIFKEIKLPLFDNAVLKKIEYKKDEIVAYYVVPDKSEKTFKKVAAFYDSVIIKKFSNNNYKSMMRGGTFFFVQKNAKPIFSIINGTGLDTKNIITYIFFKSGKKQ